MYNIGPELKPEKTPNRLSTDCVSPVDRYQFYPPHVLRADWLTRSRARPARVGFIGAGLIARYIHTYLAGTGWDFEEIGVFDLHPDCAAGFKGGIETRGTGANITIHDTAESLIRGSDMIVFATVAGEPHVHDMSWFAHNPLVLHVSLRDLAPEILLASANVVDDVEHCLKANTSPHLVEQQTANRDFLDGSLRRGTVALSDLETRAARRGPSQPTASAPRCASWPMTMRTR